MKTLREALRHPFWQAVLLLVVAYIGFKYGIAYLPPLVGIRSAPVPQSVLVQYMLTALAGILVYVSSDEERWRQFKQPIHAALVDGDKRWLRVALLVLFPLIVAFATYEETRPRVDAPIQFRSIHPAPPGQITFRGKSIQLTGLENPLRSRGSLEEHYRAGKRIYYRNCIPCHGDRLDSQGHFAHGFTPSPASFVDQGTISQLTESYVFWRIAKGGPGLPREGTPWNSAMPVWENYLTEDEIWSVIIFIYTQSGSKPRRWEAGSGKREAGSDTAGKREAGSGKRDYLEGEISTPGRFLATRDSRLATSLPASRFPLPAQPPRGKLVYERWCAGCHGDSAAGDGDASTSMLPRPRDFTKGVFKIRTTASGELPTDADLRRVVDEGMPGSAMPEWKTRLAERERDDVIAYIKSFSQFFANAAPKPIAIGKEPRANADGIAVGRETYKKLECFKCHGQDGRGDGPSAPTLKDDWDHPIRAADLTESWNFRGGSTVEQIYTRLRTGLDGTPMPSFSDVLEQKVITEEQLWRVAQYVRSLSPEHPPEVREVIRAVLARGALPKGPDDTLWTGAERYYVPLVGQVIGKPRWFTPAVDGVWVQAMHDGKRLALRLAWHDRSRSPDPEWGVWLERMAKTLANPDSAPPLRQGPDLFAVQFPAASDTGAERPYFLGGSPRRPVYLWRWASAPDQVAEGSATGLGRFTARSGVPAVTHIARYDHGEWRLQLTRTLIPADTGRATTFVPGRAIPIGFFAADGSNGEDDVRGAISAWYAIYLDVPTPTLVYGAPVATMLLTAVLGIILVVRAQRRERDSNRSSQEG